MRTDKQDHNRRVRFSLSLACVFLSAAALAELAPVELVAVDGAIRPASADYVRCGVERAAAARAQLVVLRETLTTITSDKSSTIVFPMPMDLLRQLLEMKKP